MNLFLNFGMAWIAVVAAILLSVVYLFRIESKKSDRLKSILQNVNRLLRKYHKQTGIFLVAAGLVHGLFSSEPLLSLNLGTVTWVISILLGLNWLLRKYFSQKKGWMFYHRILTVSFILALALHLIDVGIQAPQLIFGSSDSVPQPSITVDSETVNSINKQFDGATLKDGTYEGDATGFRPGLKVSVEVKDNRIVNIRIIDHNEVNSRYYSKAINAVPQEILDSQSLDVDTVSGATMTSVGIINAVNDALSQAVVSGDLPDQKELPQKRGRH